MNGIDFKDLFLPVQTRTKIADMLDFIFSSPLCPLFCSRSVFQPDL